MAIVKMKHMRLFGMAADRENLLHVLQEAGCVELSKPADEPPDNQWDALVHPSDSGLAEARADAALLTEALGTLKRNGVKGRNFFQPRPFVSKKEFFDDQTKAKAMDTARRICGIDKRILSIQLEENRLRERRLQLVPWLDLDIALDTPSTDTTLVMFGSISSQVPPEMVSAELAAASELVQVVFGRRDSERQHCVVFCHKSAETTVSEVLKQHGFTRVNLSEWHGSARESTEKIDQELRALESELSVVKNAISGEAGSRESLELILDRVNQEIARETAKEHILQSPSVFFLEGWVPAPDVPRLDAALKPFICAVELADPSEEEYPDVPVQLKNNALTRPLNMVTEMYSLPAYDGVDPNPLMAPFFIFFYGFMMADMGYGLLMMLFSVLVLKKSRPKGGMRNFFTLMGLCGISTFIMGIVTGGFFGDFLPQIAKIINPDTQFTGLPALFTPLNDTMSILIGAMCLGAVQIITGMVISFVKKLKDGQVMDAVWEEVTWWVMFLGGALAILGITKLVLYVGIVMVLVGSGWNAKGFGKVAAVFGSVYNHVTGYFGDILSYSRLMALMLAGSVIAQVFNTLGAIPGNIIFFLIISLAGNALNFALNLLGCFVHDLRLQCLEYFGKFYKDGGRPFRPLEVNTKYVDVVK